MPLLTETMDYKAVMRLAMVMAFIQFANALEYMASTPVFTFMADTFSVPVSFSGYASGLYTLGAVLSGSAAFYRIDRVNKKQFLLINMLLLAAVTYCSTLTTHFGTLLALRFFAGIVGGTTMGVGTSILINCAPENLRGKVLATVIASFPMVSIAGMPAVLFLCTHYGWHFALWSVSVLCLFCLPLIIFIVPGDTPPSGSRNKIAMDKQTLVFASCTAVVQFSPMLIIPVLTPLLMQFMGAQQQQLPGLFLTGGIVGYLSTKMTGILTSRVSALSLATVSTLLFATSLLIPATGSDKSLLFISLFLAASYSRLVAASSLAVRYPDNKQRAGFSSLQTTLMFLFTTLAFFLSSLLLPEAQITGQHLNRLLIVSALSALVFPLMVIMLQNKLAYRTRKAEHPGID